MAARVKDLYSLLSDTRRRVLHWIFSLLMAAAVMTAAFRGTMPQVTEASLASAKTAVELAIGLIGQMTLWLGLLGILEASGMTLLISRGLKPLMTRLFPEVPADHPAMGAMILNIAANMLGLDNAATPFGLKAMRELKTLESKPGVATNAMALFLTINTSGIAVIPMRAIAVRATLGSKDAAGILLPSILSSFLSTAVAIIICKGFERIARAPSASTQGDTVSLSSPAPLPDNVSTAVQPSPTPQVIHPLRIGVVLVVAALCCFAVIRFASTQAGISAEFAQTLFSTWAIPFGMLAIVMVAILRNINSYEVFVNSAKQGFHTSISVIPYLVAILVPVGMFRASGGLQSLIEFLSPLTGFIGFPAEAVPMALIRPLSGSGALGVMTDTLKTSGPDSFVGYLVSLISGSSETTFYVIAVYFGAIQTKAIRHTLAACLAADTVGLFITLGIARYFFGHVA
jgi:spore maturation protein SpmA